MHGTTSPFPSTSDRLQSPQQYKLYHCHSSARSTGKLPTVHVQMILLFFRIASAQLSCCFQPNHIVEGYSWDLLLVGVKTPFILDPKQVYYHVQLLSSRSMAMHCGLTRNLPRALIPHSPPSWMPWAQTGRHGWTRSPPCLSLLKPAWVRRMPSSCSLL